MADHYYSPKPAAGHDRRTVEISLRGKPFTFVTDAGVFAKKNIDFGSKLLIDTMEIAPDAKVLDVGCGYGPIGLAAAYLAGEGTATLIDINERAVQLASENARRNGLTNVRCLRSDLFESLGNETFTTILTNPPIRAGKELVHRIFAESVERLEDGGRLWVVIQKKQGAPSALAKLETLFPSVEVVNQAKGYRIIRATK